MPSWKESTLAAINDLRKALDAEDVDEIKYLYNAQTEVAAAIAKRQEEL